MFQKLKEYLYGQPSLIGIIVFHLLGIVTMMGLSYLIGYIGCEIMIALGLH